jgi:hypothetical protein
MRQVLEEEEANMNKIFQANQIKLLPCCRFQGSFHKKSCFLA